LTLCPVMCGRRPAFERSFGNLPLLKFLFIFPCFLAAPFSFLPFLLSVSYASLQYLSLLTSFPLLFNSLRSLTSLCFYHRPFISFFLSFSSIFSFSVHTCIILFFTLSYCFVSFSRFLSCPLSSSPTVQSKCCSQYRNAWLSDIVLCLQKKWLCSDGKSPNFLQPLLNKNMIQLFKCRLRSVKSSC